LSTRPTTFVLIDGTTLLWQINAVAESGGMQVLGIFIITDPDRTITKYFENEFDEYWNESDNIDAKKEFANFLATVN
jgi:hypothetical protein